jgi:hypothetical protein
MNKPQLLDLWCSKYQLQGPPSVNEAVWSADDTETLERLRSGHIASFKETQIFGMAVEGNNKVLLTKLFNYPPKWRKQVLQKLFQKIPYRELQGLVQIASTIIENRDESEEDEDIEGIVAYLDGSAVNHDDPPLVANQSDGTSNEEQEEEGQQALNNNHASNDEIPILPPDPQAPPAQAPEEEVNENDDDPDPQAPPAQTPEEEKKENDNNNDQLPTDASNLRTTTQLEQDVRTETQEEGEQHIHLQQQPQGQEEAASYNDDEDAETENTTEATASTKNVRSEMEGLHQLVPTETTAASDVDSTAVNQEQEQSVVSDTAAAPNHIWPKKKATKLADGTFGKPSGRQPNRAIKWDAKVGGWQI